MVFESVVGICERDVRFVEVHRICSNRFEAQRLHKQRDRECPAPPPPSNPVQVAVDGVDKKVRGLKLVSKLQAINSR